jgi:acyl-CoA synthetase (AMP-forming)/AMP-acid ligase II
VRGYNVMQGYFDDPAATAETITPEGWLMTGDIGVMNEAGYLRITDRIKDMFIVGGFNVYPAEIENLLCSLGAVAQAAVIGVPDERMGEVGVVFVVLRDSPQVTDEALLSLCRERVARFKVPRHVLRIRAEDIPATPSGRARKFLLTQIAIERLGLKV